MITFTEQEKAVIMLGIASVADADSFGCGISEEETRFAQFVERMIEPTQLAYQLLEGYFQNPPQAYLQIVNASPEKKRAIKTLLIFMCTCDGEINIVEQSALDTLDTLCALPYMSMDEVENEYRKIFNT